MYILL